MPGAVSRPVSHITHQPAGLFTRGQRIRPCTRPGSAAQTNDWNTSAINAPIAPIEPETGTGVSDVALAHPSRAGVQANGADAARWPVGSPAGSFTRQSFFVDGRVGVHLLHVVQIFQRVQQFLHFAASSPVN